MLPLATRRRMIGTATVSCFTTTVAVGPPCWRIITTQRRLPLWVPSRAQQRQRRPLLSGHRAESLYRGVARRLIGGSVQHQRRRLIGTVRQAQRMQLIDRVAHRAVHARRQDAVQYARREIDHRRGEDAPERVDATVVWKRLPAPVNIGRRRSETSRIRGYASEATPVAPVTRKSEGWSSTAQEFFQSRDRHHENCKLLVRVSAS
jgi:hypothetical protein